MKKLLVLGIIATPLLFATPKYYQVNAEEVSSVVEVIDEEEIVVEEEQEEENIKDKLTNWKDTFLVPILSGVSITSVISALVSIGFAFLNRKVIKRLEKENNEGAMYIANCKASIVDIMGSVLQVSDLVNKIIETNTLTNESINQLTDVFNNLKDKTENLIVLKDSVYKLCMLINKVVKKTPELVSNGVAEECDRIIKQIKNIE